MLTLSLLQDINVYLGFWCSCSEDYYCPVRPAALGLHERLLGLRQWVWSIYTRGGMHVTNVLATEVVCSAAASSWLPQPPQQTRSQTAWIAHLRHDLNGITHWPIHTYTAPHTRCFHAIWSSFDRDRAAPAPQRIGRKCKPRWVLDDSSCIGSLHSWTVTAELYAHADLRPSYMYLAPANAVRKRTGWVLDHERHWMLDDSAQC